MGSPDLSIRNNAGKRPCDLDLSALDSGSAIYRAIMGEKPRDALDLIFYFIDHPASLTLSCKFLNSLGKIPSLRLKWVQRDLENFEKRCWNEVFNIVLCNPDEEFDLDSEKLLPPVFRQVLSNEEVCLCASKVTLPAHIKLITWFYSAEYPYNGALTGFVTDLVNIYSQLSQSNCRHEFDDRSFGQLFAIFMAYIFFGLYSEKDDDYLSFLLFSDETSAFRRYLNEFFEHNADDVPDLSPIAFAASTNHAYYIEEIIQKIQSILNFKIDGSPPLHVVANWGNVELLKVLICSVKVDPFETEDDGGNIIACVDILDAKGRTPLHVCAAANSPNCVKTLVSHYPAANLNLQDSEGYAPLHMCSALDCQETLKLLIDNHSNPFIEDTDGTIPLLFAVLTSNVRNVEILLDAFPDTVNYKSQQQLAPLTGAASNLHLDMVECLLSYCADVSCFDFNVFYRSINQMTDKERNSNEDQIFRIYCSLLEFGFEPKRVRNLTSCNGTALYDALIENTPFAYAIESGDVELLKLFVNGVPSETSQKIREATLDRFTNARVKPKYRNFDCKKRKLSEIVEIIHQRDSFGKTLLFSAAECDSNNKVLEFLLSIGADANILSSSGDSVLHLH
ncbi:hypothetical protein HK098_001230 [Nowakowskiella sp. JEL0407]|nr:hypothetical protein HK098_001230 [Nowakowskiella sp. JEL0407]